MERPKAMEIARELAKYLLSNIDKYRLRHRCVFKVTSRMVGRFIDAKYGIASNGLVPRTLRALARVLKRYGFTYTVRKSPAGTIYYFIPDGCQEAVEDWESKPWPQTCLKGAMA